MKHSVFPWQEAMYAHCCQLGPQRHHALLLHGKPGIGKRVFARAMAAGLLCQKPQHGYACGQCQSCHWLREGTHPDYFEIMPEDDVAEEGKKKVRKRQQILIDQIRALHSLLSLSTHQSGGTRIIMLHPLEAMNVTAANALLKLLEEPPPHTQFLLIADQRQSVLPTVLSRCMQLQMPLPSAAQGIAWLSQQSAVNATWLWHYSGGAPLAISTDELGLDWYHWYQEWRPLLAAGAALDSVKAVTVLLKAGMEQAITVLQKWLLDLCLIQHKLPPRYHIDDAEILHNLSRNLIPSQLITFEHSLCRFKTTAQHPLNQELQLEQLLLQYKKMFRM